MTTSSPQGGSDDLENLLYCCGRCNQHKLDYWPSGPDDLLLWNPLREPFSKHFLELDDGTLQPLTATGAWTLERLRLNRPPLVDHRLRRSRQRARERMLRRYGELNVMLESLIEQQADMWRSCDSSSTSSSSCCVCFWVREVLPVPANDPGAGQRALLEDDGVGGLEHVLSSVKASCFVADNGPQAVEAA